jgi:hypothetical protein
MEAAMSVYLQRTSEPTFVEPATDARTLRDLNRELDQLLDQAP